MTIRKLRQDYWLMATLLSAVFMTVMLADVRYTDSDPKSSLLVSEALVTHGTVVLDQFGPAVLDLDGWAIHTKNGHYYYYFPIGSSIASVPFVAVANLFGYSMAEYENEMQVFIAALTSVATVLFLVLLARLFLPPQQAVAVSALFWFGTALSSTGGTALWSHNFATLFALIAIYLSLRMVVQNRQDGWALTAVLLFFAYLCRPTLALLPPFLILFLFFWHRWTAIRVAGLLALLLLLFSGLSYWEFGQWLPDYYQPRRLASDNISHVVYGNLFSPARGLLVFSPFLIVGLLFLPMARPLKLPLTWLLIGIAWPVAHLLIISRFPHWWAGSSYGARFMMDALPGLFLLMLRVWPVALATTVSQLLAVPLALACVFAVYVNGYQGLFNRYSRDWNSTPNVDQYPGYLFDWKYPQFFHNRTSHQARIQEFGEMTASQQVMPFIPFDAPPPVVFEGWYHQEATHRWSEGKQATIYFPLPPGQVKHGRLLIEANYLGNQQITVMLNGRQLGKYSAQQAEPLFTIAFDADLLNGEGDNSLVFLLPNASQAGNGDVRILAMALRKLTFY